MATIPIAMFMGIYMRYIRPGRIGEISVLGVLLLLGSIWLGGNIDKPAALLNYAIEHGLISR